MKWTIRIAAGLGVLVLAGLLALGGYGYYVLSASLPRLEGRVTLAGLTAEVTITRDAQGVPAIMAQNRKDLAFATGYWHAQERYFQMDMLRRAGAGELSSLIGSATLEMDKAVRVHRFRTRARGELSRMTPDARALLDVYVAGVNAGLSDLGHAPFEYAVLMSAPEPWAAEDSLLASYAMMLGLQGNLLDTERGRDRAAHRLGPAMADVLFPWGTELDAPIDGSTVPRPPLPDALPPLPPGTDQNSPDLNFAGSNNWAVAGRLTAHGGALVANDMHLQTAMPNTWLRARLQTPELDLIGVMLPGSPFIVAGSNGSIAWGFTNANIDTRDGVLLDPVDGDAGRYQTPEGPKPIETIMETICAGTKCAPFPIEETIWGPVIGKSEDGRKLVDVWVAHQPGAADVTGLMGLETARTAAEAVQLAHRAGVPNNNFVCGDREGNIAWTIIGRLPARFGHDGRTLTSWADGMRGWNGLLPPESVPVVMNPESGRLWTANNRVLGGEAGRILGDGGPDDGARAARIRDMLFAKDRFTEGDMLAIQTDTTANRARFWQELLLQQLTVSGKYEALVPLVRDWSGQADAASAGYRLIRGFRRDVMRSAYAAYLGPRSAGRDQSWAVASAEDAMRRLLRERKPGLVPPGYASWDAFLAQRLDVLAKDAGGNPQAYLWGDYNRAAVRHPLSRAIPLLGWLTDPPDRGMPGDSGVPRAQGRGFGASERFVIAPGREDEALFDMPGGQAGNPLSPYYLAGHDDWLEGRAGPLRPGPTRWTLVLTP